MNNLKKIIIVGGFVIGLSLLGIGLYMDKKHPEERYYVRNTIVKCAGILPFCASLAVSFGGNSRRQG
jgi:hypothetical protein